MTQPAYRTANWLPPEGRRGRGVSSNETSRFLSEKRIREPEDWAETLSTGQITTRVYEDRPKTIITRNRSPDVPFDRSINPYKGCEHGCVYCYARPTHTYLGLSAGLDFETKIFAKGDAAELLEAELRRHSYKPQPIAMGTNTDPYQPVEERLCITRGILEVMRQYRHPVTIVTKSARILRDLDILEELAANRLVKVALSVTTLDHKLARKMEPRASTPARRIEAIETLAAHGIPTGVMFAPVIPGLNDHELEGILQRASDAGALEAAYIMLRLPIEVANLFEEWLAEAVPNRRDRVMSHIRTMRAGRVNDPRFGKRMVGEGPYATLIRQRHRLAKARLGFPENEIELRTDLFEPPVRKGDQLRLL